MNAVTERPFQNVTITPPDFAIVELLLLGNAPLVVERFSVKAELMKKMAEGGAAKNKKKRDARDYAAEAERAKHVSVDKWEGFPASAFRNGAISACRLVGFKMTLAKLSIFIESDGMSKEEGIPLVRIYGTAEAVSHHTRNATGVIDVRSRPMYREWAMRLRIRYDRQQFTQTDVVNLIARVGGQVGIGAGRPDSKDSAGMGWGTFGVVSSEQEAKVRKQFKITA